MTFNEVFGDERTLCGWVVEDGLVRLQTRSPQFREAIQQLNRTKAEHQRPRLVATGCGYYLRVFELPMKPKTASAFVRRQLGRIRQVSTKADRPGITLFWKHGIAQRRAF